MWMIKAQGLPRVKFRLPTSPTESVKLSLVNGAWRLQWRWISWSLITFLTEEVMSCQWRISTYCEELSISVAPTSDEVSPQFKFSLIKVICFGVWMIGITSSSDLNFLGLNFTSIHTGSSLEAFSVFITRRSGLKWSKFKDCPKLWYFTKPWWVSFKDLEYPGFYVNYWPAFVHKQLL